MRFDETVRRRFVRYVAPAAALLALAGPASGSVLSFLSIEDLSRASSQVVRARILSQSVHWTPGNEGIYTQIEALVLSDIKVAAPPGGTPATGTPAARRVTIIQAGGEIDGVSLDWTGRPRFQDGEDLVLFLQPYEPADAADQRMLMVGGKQGRMRVIGHGPLQVERDLAGVLEGQAIPGAVATGPGHRRDLIDLDELTLRVRQAGGGRP